MENVRDVDEKSRSLMRRRFPMKRKIMYLTAAMLLIAAMPVQAEKMVVQMQKYDIYTGHFMSAPDSSNEVKNIVVEIREDGTFVTQPLIEWLEEQELCTVEKKTEDGVEMRHYTVDLEAAEELTGIPDFPCWMQEGDSARSDDGVMEVVVSTGDALGEFTTQYIEW